MIVIAVGALTERLGANVTVVVAVLVGAGGDFRAAEVTQVILGLVGALSQDLAALITLVIRILVGALAQFLAAEVAEVVGIVVGAGSQGFTAGVTAVIAVFIGTIVDAQFLAADIAGMVGIFVHAGGQVLAAGVAEVIRRSGVGAVRQLLAALITVVVTVFVGTLAEFDAADVTQVVVVCIGAVGELSTAVIAVVVLVLVHAVAQILAADVALVILVFIRALADGLLAQIAEVIVVCIDTFGGRFAALVAQVILILVVALGETDAADVAQVILVLVGALAQHLAADVTVVVIGIGALAQFSAADITVVVISIVTGGDLLAAVVAEVVAVDVATVADSAAAVLTDVICVLIDAVAELIAAPVAQVVVVFVSAVALLGATVITEVVLVIVIAGGHDIAADVTIVVMVLIIVGGDLDPVAAGAFHPVVLVVMLAFAVVMGELHGDEIMTKDLAGECHRVGSGVPLGDGFAIDGPAGYGVVGIGVSGDDHVFAAVGIGLVIGVGGHGTMDIGDGFAVDGAHDGDAHIGIGVHIQHDLAGAGGAVGIGVGRDDLHDAVSAHFHGRDGQNAGGGIQMGGPEVIAPQGPDYVGGGGAVIHSHKGLELPNTGLGIGLDSMDGVGAVFLSLKLVVGNGDIADCVADSDGGGRRTKGIVSAEGSRLNGVGLANLGVRRHSEGVAALGADLHALAINRPLVAAGGGAGEGGGQRDTLAAAQGHSGGCDGQVAGDNALGGELHRHIQVVQSTVLVLLTEADGVGADRHLCQFCFAQIQLQVSGCAVVPVAALIARGDLVAQCQLPNGFLAGAVDQQNRGIGGVAVGIGLQADQIAVHSHVLDGKFLHLSVQGLFIHGDGIGCDGTIGSIGIDLQIFVARNSSRGQSGRVAAGGAFVDAPALAVA